MGATDMHKAPFVVSPRLRRAGQITGAFTLVEMMVVASIMIMVAGLGMQGLAAMMRRSTTTGGPAIITAAIEGLSHAAAFAPASGRVFGLSIGYNTSAIDTHDARKQFYLVPWYCDPASDGSLGAITTFSSVASMKTVLTTIEEPMIEPNDLHVVVVLPSTTCVASYFDGKSTIDFMESGTRGSSTDLTSGQWIHLAFEPGSSLAHATFGNSVKPSAGTFSTLFAAGQKANVPTTGQLATSIGSLQALGALPMSPFEFNLHNVNPQNGAASNRKVNRVTVFGSSSVGIKAPRD